MERKDEVFVPVMHFEDRYKISNYGNLISINAKRIGEEMLAGTIYKGYIYFVLQDKGRKFKTPAHRLVARHFVENLVPDKYDTVNHLDGDKLNNRSSNLEWCTRGMNTAHAIRSGLIEAPTGFGEQSRRYKLTEKEVLEIRNKYSFGGVTMKSLAGEYNVTRPAIGFVVNRKVWNHI